jgi:hypothetical protein
MAMDGDILGTAIATAINGLTPAQKQDVTTIWKTIANVIVDHVSSTAEVTVAMDGNGLDTNGDTLVANSGTGIVS